MKYVIPAFVLLLVSSCTKTPKIEMQTLSQNLAQMKTSGTSPFDQDFNTNRYLTFSGQCITLISKFQVSVNESGVWYDIPAAQPTAVVGNHTIGGTDYPYNEVNTPPGTYDVNCSDGSFNFWMYDHQFGELAYAMGFDPAVDISPSSISVRGLAGVFATSPTVYRSSSGSSPTTATKIGLRKSGSPIGNAPWQCTELIISLADANDASATLSSATSFSLSRTVNGTGSPLNIYTDFNSCSSMISANLIDPNNITLSAGSSERRVVFKPDGSTGDINVITLAYSGSLTVSPATSTFTMRDSMSKFIELDYPWGILTGYCYPFSVNLRSYGGSNATAASETFALSTTGSLSIYDDSGCTNTIPNFTMSGLSTKTLYLRAPNGVSASTSTVQVTSAGYDLGEAQIKYDKSNDATVTSVRVDGPYSMNIWETPQMRVSRVNIHGTPLSLGSALTANLSVNLSKGVFCSDFVCTTQISSVDIPAGSATVFVYYKPQFGGTATLSASAASISATNSNVQVISGLSKLTFTTAPTALDHFGCYKYEVGGKDPSDSVASAPVSLALTITGPQSSELYSDPICSTPLGSVIMTSGTNTATFYWKPLNLTSAAINPAVIAAYPGLTSATVAVTIGQAPTLNVTGGGPHPIGMGLPIFPQFLATGAAPFTLAITTGSGTLNSASVPGQMYQNYFAAAATSGQTSTLSVTDGRSANQSTSVITVAPRLELDFTVSDTMSSGGTVKVDGTPVGTGWTFTRTSSAFYYDINGYLVSAGTNSPRIDHDPTHADCNSNNCPRKGLLIEPNAQNLISDNTNMATGWTTMQATKGTASTTSPKGFAESVAWVTDSDTGNPGAVDTTFQAFSTVNGKYTASVYLKNSAGPGYASLYWGEVAHSCTGLVVNLTSGSSGPNGWCGLPQAYEIQKLRNGWFRVIMTMNFDGGYTGNFRIYSAFNSDGSSSANNSITGTVWVYGAQVEYGDTATSLIQTSGGGGTRMGDKIKFPTTIGGGWYSGLSVGTFMMEWMSASQGGNQVQLLFKDSGSAFHLVGSSLSSGSVVSSYSSSAGAPITLPSRPPQLGLNRASFSFSNTAQLLSVDSTSSAGTAAVSNPTTLTELYVGSDQGGLNQTIGHIQKLKYFEAELHPASVKSMGFIEP